MTKPSPAWIDSSSRRKDVCTCASADHPRKISTPEKTNIFLSFMGLYVGSYSTQLFKRCSLVKGLCSWLGPARLLRKPEGVNVVEACRVKCRGLSTSNEAPLRGSFRDSGCHNRRYELE